MIAMATLNAASMMQTTNLTSSPKALNTSNLSSSTVRVGAMRLAGNNIVAIRPARNNVFVRAGGNPERIDNFVEGAKSDASKNAMNVGETVSDKLGEAQETVKDVGRDMGAKTQEALDAVSRKLDQTGYKAHEVGDEVKGSTQSTLDSSTDTADDQSVVNKAKIAARYVGEDLK